MATTDFLNTNENAWYPLEHNRTVLNGHKLDEYFREDEILDCGFFIVPPNTRLNVQDDYSLHWPSLNVQITSKEETDDEVAYKVKVVPTYDYWCVSCEPDSEEHLKMDDVTSVNNLYPALEFRFKKSDEWQGKWMYSDDNRFYGFLTIGRSK